jgi:hypothetical protein
MRKFAVIVALILMLLLLANCETNQAEAPDNREELYYVLLKNPAKNIHYVKDYRTNVCIGYIAFITAYRLKEISTFTVDCDQVEKYLEP